MKKELAFVLLTKCVRPLQGVVVGCLLLHGGALAAQTSTATDSGADTAVSESVQERDAREHDAAEAKAVELLAAPDLPVGTKTVSLSESLRLAQKRNLTVKQMALEFDKADARLRQARALLLPVAQAELKYIMADHADKVNLGAGFTPPGTAAPPSSTVVINPRNNVNGSVSVSIPVVNLSNWRNYQLAKSGNALTPLTVEEARQNVLYATAQAYFAALMSRTLVDLYKEQIVATRVHLHVAEEKFYAGSGLRIDMLRAGIDFEQAEEDLLNARLSLAASCDALGMLAGENGMLAPSTADALQAPEMTDASLEKQAMAQRVDVSLNRKNVEISNEQVKAALAALFPSLNLAWQGTYQFTNPSGFGSTDRSRWNVMLSLSIPLFNAYTYAKISENKAIRRQSEIALDALTQNVGQEVRQARREYETALANVRGSERKVRLAKESLQLAEDAYDAGAGTSLDVTDARRMYLQAEVNLAATELKTQLALLTLLKDIGEKPAHMMTK